eukprot:Ihof_evm2s780 gene=Ihof_evmTU2s780
MDDYIYFMDHEDVPTINWPTNPVVTELEKPIPTSEEAPTPSNDSTNSDGGWGNWGWGVISALKEKTDTLVEATTGDLGELMQITHKNLDSLMDATYKDLDVFVNTVEQEAVGVVTGATTAIKGDESGLNTWLGSFAGKHAGSPKPKPSSSPRILTAYDRRQAYLKSLQSSPTTFCTEPEHDFESWEETFNLNSKTEEIARLLIDAPELKAAQTNLVPRVISYETFWKRYFYKVYLYDLKETRKEELKMKVILGKEEELSWDDDDEEEENTNNIAHDDVPANSTSQDPQTSLDEIEKKIPSITLTQPVASTEENLNKNEESLREIQSDEDKVDELTTTKPIQPKSEEPTLNDAVKKVDNK